MKVTGSNLSIFNHGIQSCVKVSEFILIVDVCKIPLPTVSFFSRSPNLTPNFG